MASGIAFVEFVMDQLKEAGKITCRKMFGEYGIYCDGKIFALVCDNQLYLKITEAGQKLCPDLPRQPPYEGAKDYFLVEDVEDRDALTKLAEATCRELPEPKPRKRKGKRDGI